MAEPKWFVAQDTFNVDELADGGNVTVTRGQMYPAGHEIVLKDGGRGLLFKPAPEPEPESKPAVKAAPRLRPVKDSG